MKKIKFLVSFTLGVSFLCLSLNTINQSEKALAEIVVNDNDKVRMPVVSFGEDSSTTMTFTWSTTNYTNTVVEIVEDTKDFVYENIRQYFGTIEVNKVGGGEGYIHRVIVDDLTPNTKYKYKVGDPSLEMSEIGTFKTSSTTGNVSFLHISDPQGTTESDYLSYNNLLKTATSNFDYDFIALTGDIVNNSWAGSQPVHEQWEWALTNQFDVLKDYPVMAVSGNHEAASYDFSSHFTYQTSDAKQENGIYYSFTYNGVYFLALNTNEGMASEPGSSLSLEQMEFIRNDLELHKDAKWKIVLMHKGIFDGGSHSSNLAEGEDYDIAYYRNDLAPLFSEYNIDLVLQGHDHLYSRSYPIYSSSLEGTVTHNPDVNVTSEEFNGVEYLYKPNGPIYFNTGSASGSKFYSPNMSEEMAGYIQHSANPIAKLFTNIEIDQENDRLSFITYKQENNSYELYQSFGINKGELLNVETNITPPKELTEYNIPLIITLSVVGGVVLVLGLALLITLFIKRRKK